MRTPPRHKHARRPGSYDAERPWKHRAPSTSFRSAKTPGTTLRPGFHIPARRRFRPCFVLLKIEMRALAADHHGIAQRAAGRPRGHVGHRLSDKAVHLKRAPVVPAHNQRYDAPVITPPCDDVHVALFVQCNLRASFALRRRCVRSACFPACPSCNLFHAHLLSWVLSTTLRTPSAAPELACRMQAASRQQANAACGPLRLLRAFFLRLERMFAIINRTNHGFSAWFCSPARFQPACKPATGRLGQRNRG